MRVLLSYSSASLLFTLFLNLSLTSLALKRLNVAHSKHRAPFPAANARAKPLPRAARSGGVTSLSAGQLKTNTGACIPQSGRWVQNYPPPRYTPDTCPYLKKFGSLNCLKWRKNQVWLSYSWEPVNCAVTRFNAQHFLTRMRGKTLAFAGDSMMVADFFPSLLCQISAQSAVQEHLKGQSELGTEFGTDAYTVPQFNITLLVYWSPFLMATSKNAEYLSRLKKQNITVNNTAVNLQQMDPAFGDRLHRFHMLTLLSYTHWPRAKTWARRFFVDHRWRVLQPQPDTTLGFRVGMQTILKRLTPSRTSLPLPSAYFLSPSPRLAACQQSGGLISPMSHYKEVLTKNSASSVWFPMQADLFSPQSSIKFVDITHLSLLRADAMVAGADSGSSDCLHPCLPGLPDTWVDTWYLRWLGDRRFN